jgi:hypothetical protein
MDPSHFCLLVDHRFASRLTSKPVLKMIQPNAMHESRPSSTSIGSFRVNVGMKRPKVAIMRVFKVFKDLWINYGSSSIHMQGQVTNCSFQR